MNKAVRYLRWLGIAAVIIGYSVLANFTNHSTENGALGALVALAPVAFTALLLSWRSSQRRIMLLLLVLATALLWLVWPVLKQHFGWIYWLEHEGVQIVLLIAFAQTLFANRKPLCTQFAEIVHGPLQPRHAHYARQVTVAWTVFFATMILISTTLFFMQPITTWSIFANFIFLPLVALMFIVEYAVRKLVIPDLEQTHLMDAVRAFVQHSAQQRS